MQPTVILDGSDIEAAAVGGKGFALNRMIGMGLTVPPAGAITTGACHGFIETSGLDAFIAELRGEGPPAHGDLDSAAERVDAAFPVLWEKERGR